MLTTSEVISKRTQTYLSNKERWAIATYCIENRCVIQDVHAYPKDGPQPAFIPFTLWRVKKKNVCVEIKNDCDGLKISEHHLNQSIEFYNEVCELTGKYPVIPPIEDTVEKDMLTVENKRLKNDIKEITEEYTKLKTAYNTLTKTCSGYFSSLKEMAKLIPADCFGVKSATIQKTIGG